ncbi:hypothetical protein [Desulfovibrio sp. ZJ200]|uniref:hypothetical protein n=1 Tax=Desulfovibrio sp. ZJ200 TaxID=2709792 RepID=UPI00197FF11A|nr:hypothetical protein [Desulfovibrio sp. ZJ200]
MHSGENRVFRLNATFDFHKKSKVICSSPTVKWFGFMKSFGLSNKLLEGQVERNRQRKVQRGWIFGVGVSFCCLFYAIFCIIIIYSYYNFSALPAMPVAWVFPLIGLLTVPTLFLAVMVLCLYRDRPEINPDVIAKALWKIISNLPK